MEFISRQLVVLWGSPYRFPSWEAIVRSAAVVASCTLLRIQPGNLVKINQASLLIQPPFGNPVHGFTSSQKWNPFSWRNEFAEQMDKRFADRQEAIVIQLDEDEYLSPEQLSEDVERMQTEHLDAMFYRFDIPTLDKACPWLPAGAVYPLAPHCKIFRWRPGVRFSRPGDPYQGYAAPRGYPRQPNGNNARMSQHRIQHLLFATPELRRMREPVLRQVLARVGMEDRLPSLLIGQTPPDALSQWIQKGLQP